MDPKVFKKIKEIIVKIRGNKIEFIRRGFTCGRERELPYRSEPSV